jgi:hypothetical protein
MALAKKSFDNEESEMGNEGAADTSTRPLTANERVAVAAAKTAAAAEAAAEADTEAKTITKAAEEKTAAPSEQRAVAAAPNRAVGAAVMKADPFKPLDNALTVDWNTLPRVMATNGGFQNKETQKMMGDELKLEILSIQEHWVVSPGGDINDEEARPYLKYSDDGKTTREGEDVQDCVQRAIDAGYTKAALKKRCILVGALVFPGSKMPEMEGDLIQIDLAPNSLKNFNQHRFTTAYKVGKGQVAAETANIVKITALVKNENKLNWTEALFSAA